MNGPRPTLSRAVLRLLRPFLPADWADDILRDLEEAHERRRRTSPLQADLWLWRQAILFAASVWYIYRIVKGWLRLAERKPMYPDSAA